MKFIATLLPLVGFLKVQSQSLDKPVTLHFTNVEFRIVLKEMKNQTGITFAYNSDVLEIVGKVTVNVDNKKVQEVLELCLKDFPVVYKQKGNVIRIRKKKENTLPTIVAKTEDKVVAVPDKRRDSLSAKGTSNENMLDQVLVIGYGKTDRRVATGDVGTVSRKKIENHRTGDVLAVLSGRITRLLITQTNGLPESYSKTQLDGQAAVGTKPGRLPFSDPLFVIDGIPFAPNNNSLQIAGSGNALGAYGRSPMAFIDPNNIDHIEVLKDADATSIFGSRGAKGVIMITTKQGDTGKLKVTADLRFLIRKPTRTAEMLNTTQYLQMRHEALNNDAESPAPGRDNDLLLYDTTRYIDFKKEFLSNNAPGKEVIISFSGASKYNFRYYLGTNYHEETTVFPGSLGSKRADLFLHLNYASPNKKLTTSLTANYSNDDYDLISTDLTQILLLAPDSPPLRDADNKTNWGDQNNPFNNPLAYLDQKYHSRTENTLVSLHSTYQLSKNWCVKVTGGHNSTWSTEKSNIPIRSLNPYLNSPLLGSAYFGTNVYKSLIAEPQIEYNGRLGRGKFNVLAGNSWQRIINENGKINATGYKTDGDYSSIIGAANIEESGTPKNVYNYRGLFGRINYNWENKYIGNLTGRMDWSNRFGITRMRRGFAALGAAWVFSNESFFKELKFISFGKIRASYGVTGNDPIGDVQYFDAGGRNNIIDYLTQLKNAELSAEVTSKLNGGIDLAFLQDKLLLTMNWFNNKSSNLVVSPDNLIKAANWPVKIQNTGFDFSLRYEKKAKDEDKKKLSWSIEAILTLPSNKLVSFADLESSSYASIFQQGKSLTLLKGYHYLGVNPTTGLFRFEDKNKDNKIDDQDLGPVGNLDPTAYGGMEFEVSYKKLHFSILMEGRVQTGYSYLNSILQDATPGIATLNQPVEVLNRWQQPGNNATFQRFTMGNNKEVLNANNTFIQSDGRYTDASFLRAKNINLSAGFPDRWVKKLHLRQGCIYFQSNNTFTFTHYRVLDPETQVFITLPPMKTYLVGLKFGF